MRKGIVLLCLLMLLGPEVVQAQSGEKVADGEVVLYALHKYQNDAPGRLSTPVSVSGGEQSIAQLLRSITDQSGLSISFDTDQVARSGTKTISFQDAPVARVLLSILDNTGLEAMVSPDWRIIIVPKTKSRPVRHRQTVRGTVVESLAKAPLLGATVVVTSVDPPMGATTNAKGRFELSGVPVGRHDIEVRFLGFKTSGRTGVLVGSGKEVALHFELEEQVFGGDVLTVVPETEKNRPVNELASVSAKQFTVEEARRYAGGIDDPARLASAFAGVTTTGRIGENALIIRGNAPKGVLWRLEGVDIPNPNHFAGLSVAGGGGVTIFSSHVLDDSDFLTGAFPAEYGNAVAGVFDMHLRRGNSERREHTFQAGLMGIDFATEGPFRKGSDSSYLLNYRYSTLGILLPLLPTESLLTYQDLSFKTSFDVSGGRLEFWGIGGLDKQRQNESSDTSEWQYLLDRSRIRLSLGMGATGLSWRRVLGPKTYLSATLAAAANYATWEQWTAYEDGGLEPESNVANKTGRGIFGATLNHKFSRKVFTRAGVEVHRLFYDFDLAAGGSRLSAPTQVALASGSSSLARMYAQTRVGLSERISLDAGFHGQYFALNKELSIEPRGTLRIGLSDKHSVSAAYGLHSQIEGLRFYHVGGLGSAGAATPNRNMRMTKAHHGVLGYEASVGRVARLRLEGYYQFLYDVPVVSGSSYSLINLDQDFEFAEKLVNEGAGRNVGIDLTMERFLQDGYYFMATGSVFRSRYRGGDKIWRDSRFDQQFAFNLLAGKEIETRRGSIIGLNARFSMNGGNRRSPVDEVASIEQQKVIYDENQVFRIRASPQSVLDLTLTFQRNRTRTSSVWALQIKNVLGTGVLYQDYDFIADRPVEANEVVILPVLSYKVEF